jgi:hypothetical protein
LSPQCKISPKEKPLCVGRYFDTIVDEWFRHRSNYYVFNILKIFKNKKIASFHLSGLNRRP